MGHWPGGAVRKIKVRIWHEQDNLMYGPWSMVEIAMFAERVFNTNPATGARLKWMQYTGLEDKNGKEICEGDIVIWHGWGEEKPQEVRWSVHEDQDYSLDTYGFTFPYTMGRVEVIGNIYENPELLEEKNERESGD